ncbi:unnamed protein product [Eruca vesicaria subsp. sativa]|uniref:RING-type E3 ubiquitin transferase n=1 Tax=Eruca vesicaria subsp. sativa TaxID=29727 RepID=A0ABC8IW76_ERUVS|nr:unnamed protein product [Eruca vesicaria subsp. sativa]
MRFHGITSPGSRSSRSSVTEEPVSRLIEEKIFVAVDKHVAKSKSTLIWALQNTGGKKICIIHVHQPSQMIPVMGAKFPVSSVKEEEVNVFREKEREKVNRILDEYLCICQQRGVKKAAVVILSGLTGSEEGLQSLSKYSEILLPSLSRLLSESKEVSEPSAQALVNLSQNSELARKMIQMGLIRVAMDMLYKPESCITRNHDVSAASFAMPNRLLGTIDAGSSKDLRNLCSCAPFNDKFPESNWMNNDNNSNNMYAPAKEESVANTTREPSGQK